MGIYCGHYRCKYPLGSIYSNNCDWWMAFERENVNEIQSILPLFGAILPEQVFVRAEAIVEGHTPMYVRDDRL